MGDPLVIGLIAGFVLGVIATILAVVFIDQTGWRPPW